MLSVYSRHLSSFLPFPTRLRRGPGLTSTPPRPRVRRDRIVRDARIERPKFGKKSEPQRSDRTSEFKAVLDLLAADVRATVFRHQRGHLLQRVHLRSGQNQFELVCREHHCRRNSGLF